MPLVPASLPLTVVGGTAAVADQLWVSTTNTSYIHAYRADFLVTAPFLYVSFQQSPSTGTCTTAVMLGTEYDTFTPGSGTATQLFEESTSASTQYGRTYDLEDELGEPMMGEILRMDWYLKKNTSGTAYLRPVVTPLLTGAQVFDDKTVP